jgi:hypothetical protein
VDRRVSNTIAGAIVSVILYFFARSMMGDARPACASVLKNGFQALQIYAVERDQRFPPAASWMSELGPAQSMFLRCDKVPEGNGYAFNDRYGGAIIPSEGDDPRALLYDSSKLGRNEHDAFESLPSPPRHGSGNNVIDAVGTLSVVKP